MNLFFFPFAGASKYSFNQLTGLLADGIQAIPIELPGRGTRINEPLLKNIHEMAIDIYDKIRCQLGNQYAFYGHSMGTVLAYLVTKMILADQLIPPKHLFLSGRGGPDSPNKGPIKHLLSKSDFIQELKIMGGIPDEAYEDDLLMEYIEPVLRSDLEAIESYQYQASPPFNIPIMIMTGSEENITMEEVKTWEKETINKV
jgi:surfactin synthase thioesterase subunit